MTVAVVIPERDGHDPGGPCAAVRAGMEGLLADVGVDPAGVTVTPGPPDPAVAAVVGGTPVPFPEDLGWVLGDDAAAVVAALADAARHLLGAPPYRAGPGERPLVIGISPDDVTRLAGGDPVAWDLGIREALMERVAVPLPGATVVDADVAPGTVAVRAAGVRYPPLPVGDDPDGGGYRVHVYLEHVVRANAAALLTPAAVDAILWVTARSLPHAARLARARWSDDDLVRMLGEGIVRVRPEPRDLPALVEAAALAPGPPGRRP